jgi:membrane protease YdiL (CAAX protease family)
LASEANLSSMQNDEVTSVEAYRPAGAQQTSDASGLPASDALQTTASFRIWPIPLVVLIALGLHVSTSIVTLLVSMVLVRGGFDPGMFADPAALQSVAHSRLGLTLTLVIPQAMMILPVMIAATLSPVPFRQRLALVRGTWPIKLWISSALATPVIGLVSSMLVGGLMGESESLQDMSEMFRQLGQGGFFIPLAVMVGLTPGICEELLFRGYVQTRLNQRLGAVFGVLVTSLVFAAFHMDLVHSTAVIGIGIYLGWLSWASGSIFPAMIAHFVNNFLSVAAVVFLPEPAIGGGPVNPEDIPETAALAMSAVVIASVIALIVTLRQARRHRQLHTSA